MREGGMEIKESVRNHITLEMGTEWECMHVP